MSDQLDRLKAALADRYAIERELGAGGMATVYLAHDVKHDRKVAVKVLRPELAAVLGAERFVQEIKTTANLQHPHILPLFDSGETDSFLYYVMPCVEGETLRDKLSREKQLAVQEAVEIGSAVAAALDYAHRRDIIHRDIKPENILLHDGQALVADFGIALAAAAAGKERITATGLAVGTPTHMSPEQAAGETELDGRSDLYSLGCVLYEMLAGEPPYTGPNPQAIAAKRLLDPVLSLRRLRPAVPPLLDAAIVRVLNRVPADRFATASEFRAVLMAAISAPSDAVSDTEGSSQAVVAPVEEVGLDQEIQFCATPDGVSIAYAIVGEGPPLVKAANWLSHLEFDWESPVWRHWWTDLAKYHRLIRYDERGCGLSDWNVDDFTLEAWVRDLETVVDAVSVEQFPLLGISQGGAVAVEYAVRHPERVSHLILHGVYPRGKLKRDTSDRAVEDAQLEMSAVRIGWGKENPAFRQLFSMLFFPEATPEEMQAFNELQRVSTSPENAGKFMGGFHHIDVREVARQVSVPTLVLHSKHEARVPFEEGRLMASLIPGARFVPLDSKNHIPLEHEPAWQHFLDAVRGFLGVSGGGSASPGR